MLEATGWYIPNYDFAEPFFFGQGQGCNFLTESCSSSGFNFDDFCTGSGKGCTPQGSGGGFCSSDIRSDGCKFVHADINYDCQSPDAAQNARLPALESYGRTDNSRCFSGTLSTENSAGSDSFCFKYSCSGSGSATVVTVELGSETVTCKSEGTMPVTGYEGTINCPDPLTFCQTAGLADCPRNCMGRGSCENNQCSCYSGFTGIDCGLNL